MTKKLNDADLDRVRGGVDVTRLALNGNYGPSGNGGDTGKPGDEPISTDAKVL